ncbi:MAG: glycosyltransferase family 2 protein [Bacteroidia bacterium]
MNTSVTAIIPTKNESHHIIDALKCVAFADEIIIIDSYSTDDTVEKAKKFNPNAIILQRAFDDFSSQKNFAIEKAKHDWIFILDADERVGETLRNEIISTVNNPKYDAYWIYRKNHFMGKAIHYSGLQNDKVIRLFNKKYCKYHGNVHEEIVCSSNNYGFLKNKIEHYSYTNWQRFIDKQKHYTTLQANELFKKGKSASIFHFVVKPLARFLKHYVIQLGFLDGYRGLVLSYIFSKNVYNRYAALNKLNKSEKSH